MSLISSAGSIWAVTLLLLLLGVTKIWLRIHAAALQLEYFCGRGDALACAARFLNPPPQPQRTEGADASSVLACDPCSDWPTGERRGSLGQMRILFYSSPVGIHSTRGMWSTVNHFYFPSSSVACRPQPCIHRPGLSSKYRPNWCWNTRLNSWHLHHLSVHQSIHSSASSVFPSTDQVSSVNHWLLM